ncbi:MAG: hypothetical protein V4459_08505 [Pseudomonadota bacterium]
MTTAITTGKVRRGLVLDVETRIDRRALRASGRHASPRGMPTGLQVIVAAAMLSFEIGADGICRSFALRSADCAGSGERTLIRLLDRELARLHEHDGALVTFNGSHDLSMVRLATLRHREFASSGAARWIADGQGRHDDLMLQLSGDQASRWASLADLSAALGLHAPGEVVLGAPVTTLEVAKCEFDVVVTMALYMHVLAERQGSDEALRLGIPALAAMVAERLDRSPHLRSALEGRLFQDYAAV